MLRFAKTLQQPILVDDSRASGSSAVTLDNFKLIQMVGRGSFGKVFVCRERSSKEVLAIKIMTKQMESASEEVRRQAVAECRVLRRLKHPFIAELKHSFMDHGRLCLAMEFINGGELFFHLARETVFYGAEIVLALAYLHNRGIIFRDLKLENLLLDNEGHIKIVDFGLAKEGIEYGTTTKTFCGTPEYLAPEIVNDSEYGWTVDWWCFGVVMFQLMCGRFPFDRHDVEVLFMMILDVELQLPSTLSSRAKSLLRGLLNKDPALRLGGGVDGAEEIKKHGFFRSICWKKIAAKEIEPPFKPNISSTIDTRYFDSEITEENSG